ncbi:MAG: peptide chain release factor 2 [Dehalococcoidia bacterium]
MRFNSAFPIYWCVFDVPGSEARLTGLEQQSGAPGFWDDAEQARAVMQEIASLRAEVDTWRGLERRAGDLAELLKLAIAEGDESIGPSSERELRALEREVDQLEFRLMLSGPYDRRNAILAVHAGAGGTESQDWAEMLLRMYLRWAERHNFETDILDTSEGDEAGIKSATVEVKGPYAYGYLQSERGVHRLVRISPFDAAHARHTSFAKVEVLPEVESTTEVEINPDDLRVDVFRASGHGGQNVQKNATAVRLTHLPTGIVVVCQNERSLHRNREAAMKVLEARLLEVELLKQEEEKARLKGKHVDMGWGNQIRSYVLHPYKMVKDHRTDFESTDPAAVLDGDLDDFISAYLQSRVGEE